jgi:hypothetical protein
MLLCSEYALISTGSCQSNYRYDVLQEDCKTAAVAWGLRDTSLFPFASSYYNDFPSGCWYTNKGFLSFNTAESSTATCGTADRDCLCGRVVTGSPVNPQF